MNYQLLATKTSLITVTRNNSVDLQKAVRRVLNKLYNFYIADIEYSIDPTEGGTKYSAIITGAVPEGYINLDENQTQFPDDIDPTPIINPEPTEPTNPDEPTPEQPSEVEEKLGAIEQQQQETKESITEMQNSIDELKQLVQALLQAQQTSNNSNDSYSSDESDTNSNSGN